MSKWHVKDPSHTAKTAGGRLYLNIHAPLTQASQNGMTILSRHCVGTYLGTIREASSHTTQQGAFEPQVSQIAALLWTDPGLKSGIGDVADMH